MKLTINGETREFPDTLQTLPEVLHTLGIPLQALLVEHNGVALHRSEWEGRPVKEGDRLELLRIAAGG